MDSSPEAHLPIPKSYEVLRLLGKGGFGEVVECVKRGSTQTVAIKVGKYGGNLSREAAVMRDLMRHHMDNFNIIKFHGTVKRWGITSLVFEKLDINLQSYLANQTRSMRLEAIRNIIQQMATALHGLKSMGVIHSDVKIDNIMLVDHTREPLEVKLIDFGLALRTSKATPGMVLQIPQYRCPEILLGLPFSEAIDIWSLGCVMEIMMLGFMLFPAMNEYNVLRFIIDLLGPPADYLLNAGMRTKEFFKKTKSNQWILKTPKEYWGSTYCSTERRSYKFRSLETLKLIRLDKDNPTEADERRECVELLKGMLTWDGKLRMTPHDILNHPFITKSYLSSCNECQESVAAEPITSQTQTLTSTNSDCRDSVPSGVILVQPEAPMNQMHLEETPGQDSDMRDSLRSGVIMVQPEAPVNQTHLEETPDQDTDMRDSVRSGVILVQPEAPMNQTHLKETPGQDSDMRDSLRSGVIMVQPAAPMNQTHLEETPGQDTDMRDSVRSGVIMVQPEAPMNQMHLEETPDQDTDMRDSVPSGVILVQPEAPMNQMHLEETPGQDGDMRDSLRSGVMVQPAAPMNQMHQDDEDREKSPKPSVPAATVLDSIKVHPDSADLSPTPSDKKKKNCLKRFLSWMKRTFGSCCTKNDVQDSLQTPEPPPLLEISNVKKQ